VHVHVGAGDRAALLACFDETAASAFGVLCRLCAGDSRLALDLLGDTYAYVERTAASTRGLDVDVAWIVDAAHSVYAARAPRRGTDELEPVASLPAPERVVVHLHEVERRPVPAIATLLGTTTDEIELLLGTGRVALHGGAIGASVADAFRRGEVWFDDVMRAEVRARVGGRSPAASGAADNAAANSPIADPAGERATALLSRRTMITAGAGASIAALVGIGVWLGSGNDGQSRGNELPEPPKQPSTTTTPVTPTTTPTTTPPTTTPATVDAAVTGDTVILDSTTGEVAVVTSGSLVVAPTGFIVDPLPADLLPAGGYMDTATEMRNWVQIWASPDADHMSGRWLALLVMDSSRSTPIASDVSRVVIGGNSGVLRLDSSGSAQVMVALTDTVRVEARSFGFSAEMLDVVFAGMSADDERQPVFAAPGVLDGLDLIASHPSSEVSVAYDVIDGDRSTLYTSADGSRYVSIVAGPQRAGDRLATRLLSEPSIIQTTIAYSSERTISVGGREMLIGAIDELGPDLFIQMHDGGFTVTISGNVKLTTLFEIAANTRRATFDEWMSQRSATVPPPANRPDPSSTFFFGTGNLLPIGQVTTSSDSEWTVSIKADEVDDAGRLGVRIEHGLPGTGTATRGSIFSFVVPDADHPVSAFVEVSATILVGVFESVGSAVAMRVTVDGKMPADVPLVVLGATSRSAAAYAFIEIADYSVALVDASGAVVQEVDV